MFKILKLFQDSLREIKTVKCITLSAMLGAISIVLGYFTIMIADFLKVSFTFLPNTLVFYLFGPVVGMIYGAAMDLLNFIVKPTGTFYLGFTASAMVTGLLYGLVMYKRPFSLKRLCIANLLVMIIVKIAMNTYWLTDLLGDSFSILLPMRIVKELALFPLETAMMLVLYKGVERSGVLKLLDGIRRI